MVDLICLCSNVFLPGESEGEAKRTVHIHASHLIMGSVNLSLSSSH